MQKELCSTCELRPRRNGTSYKCKECHANYMKDYYQRNPDGPRSSSKKLRINKREFIKQAKAKPCMDCGNEFPYYVMDFDHIRGEKSFNISIAAGKYSLDRIKEEIEKCDVVCANCHRKRTFGE